MPKGVPRLGYHSKRTILLFTSGRVKRPFYGMTPWVIVIDYDVIFIRISWDTDYQGTKYLEP